MLRNLTEQLSANLRRATNFLQSKYMRRTLFAFSMVSVLIGLFVFVSPVKAEGLSDIANGLINAVSYILIEIAGIFMQITIFALKFFIELAGYNNYIDASIVKLGWNMVRDVANMFFVVILLVIAFGTILGLEQYEWKKTLAKLIMSAFLVNFSNLICQVIIDVSQVFTITFLNAIAGAAGGNLIKMFNFDEILQIAQRGTDPSGIQIELFGGAVMTIVFAGMAMATIGAYLVVMIARMVVLWTMMILSPLAFLFAALPNTQSIAQEFWNQFTHQVIVAPVMVFFLWLAFATFGGGDIVQQDIETNHPLIADGGIRAVTESTDVNGNSLGITFSKAASWENMANFAVAIAFLWIGLERVQKLGVVGGGLVSGAMSFGKNVATIASGVALGRWMGRKGVEGAKFGANKIGAGLYAATAKNRVEIIGNAINRNIEGWGAWRGRGADPVLEDKRKAAGELSDATANKTEAQGGPKNGDEGVNKEGNKVKYDESRKGWYETDKDDKEGWARERSKKTGEVVKDFARDKNGMPELGPNTNNAVQRFFHGRQMALIASRKNLEKVKNQKKVREDLMDKRVTAVPKYLMQKAEGAQPDAFDRMEQGMLEAEQMRSAAKTEEFKALGKNLVLNSQREKDGQRQEGGTVAQQIAAHKTNAGLNAGLAEKVQEKARKDYLRDKGTDVIRATMDAKLEVDASKAESAKLEAAAMTGVVMASERQGDGGALARKTEAEKGKHSEEIKQKLVEKREEGRFLEGKHGQAEVQEEAALLAATAAVESQNKRIEEKGVIDAMAAVQAAKGAATPAFAAAVDPINPAATIDPFKNEEIQKLHAAQVAEELKRAKAGLTRGVKEDEGATLIKTEEARLGTAAEEEAQRTIEGQAKLGAARSWDGTISLFNAAKSKLQSEAEKGDFDELEKLATERVIDVVVNSDSSKAAKAASEAQAQAEAEASRKERDVKKSEEKIAQLTDVGKANQAVSEKQAKVDGRKTLYDKAKKDYDELEGAFDPSNIEDIAVVNNAKIVMDNAALQLTGAEVELTDAKDIAAKAASPDPAVLASETAKLDAAKQAAEAAKKAVQMATQAATDAASKVVMTLIDRINLAEQGKLAADNFVKNIREGEMGKKFEKAGKAIIDASKKGGQALVDLISQDRFVAAMQSSKLLASNQESNKVLRDDAEAEAEKFYIDKDTKGYSAPSSSLVAMAKRTADELNGYTNEALGKALTDNLAFVANAKKNGKKLDLKQKMALFGTTNKVNSEAYIDDTFFQMMKQMTLFHEGKITDSAQAESIKQLEDVWVDQLGVITRITDKSTGKVTGFTGNYGEEVSALMQNYAISGGNIDYVQKHQAIAANMKANPGKTYANAMKEVLGGQTDNFLAQMDELESFTKEAASAFKNQALAAGHRQLGGHQLYDSELGRHRFATQEESRGIMEAEMRKRGSKVNYQYHSLGEIDQEGILRKVAMEHFRSTVGQAKTYLEIKSVQDRTRDGALGYAPSQDKVMNGEYGVLGASEADVIKRFGSIQNFIKDVIIPELAGGAKAVGLLAQSKFDNVNKQEAESGILKIQIAGTNIKANNLSDLISQVKGYIKKNPGMIIDESILKELNTAQSAAESLLTEQNKGKKKGRSRSNSNDDVDDQP